MTAQRIYGLFKTYSLEMRETLIPGREVVNFRFTIPPVNPRAFTQKCVPTVGPSQQNGLTPRDLTPESCPTPGLFTLHKNIN